MSLVRDQLDRQLCRKSNLEELFALRCNIEMGKTIKTPFFRFPNSLCNPGYIAIRLDL